MEHLGTDLQMAAGDLVAGVDGDLVFDTGPSCLATDLLHRLGTQKGSYWRHLDEGMGWDNFLQSELTPAIMRAMEIGIVREIERDPRVVSGSGTATVNRLDIERLKIEIRCMPESGGNELNLVVGFNLVSVSPEVL